MAAVSDGIGPAGELTILDALPAGFLDCGARDLHLILDGPTLIELAGEREPPLFVSCLLHGNENSGLSAIQRVIGSYRDRPLARPLMLLVGNVAAARHGLRRLDSQPDYNRIWPGMRDARDTPEARIMEQVHSRVLGRGALAAIDLHNNSGRNPHYSVVCKLDPATLGLAALFSRRVVLFRGIPGTQTASFAGLIPAMTAECGLPSEATNAEAAARLLEAALNLLELPARAAASKEFDLHHTLGIVRVRKDVTFGFGACDAELRFAADLDGKNFRELEPGTVLGKTTHPMPLQMIDEAGSDVAAEYLVTESGELRLRKPAVPAMLTTDARIVRQDCLCYLMERL